MWLCACIFFFVGINVLASQKLHIPQVLMPWCEVSNPRFCLLFLAVKVCSQFIFRVSMFAYSVFDNSLPFCSMCFVC